MPDKFNLRNKTEEAAVKDEDANGLLRVVVGKNKGGKEDVNNSESEEKELAKDKKSKTSKQIASTQYNKSKKVANKTKQYLNETKKIKNINFDELAKEEKKPEGYVKRNFSVSRHNMARVKTLVRRAKDNGQSVTQDDVINQLLDERFEEIGLE